MKILYLGRYNESEQMTGPEKVAKRIYNESYKVNDTVFVEYYFDGSEYGLNKKLFGKETINQKLNIERFGIFRLLIYFFQFKPDIIHIITFERFAALAYLCKIFSKVKIIYNVHGVAVYENKEFKTVSQSLKKKDEFCEKKFMKLSDMLLFLSQDQLKIAKEYYDIPNKKIEFINNGVDTEFNRTGLHEVKQEIPSLVFIGDSERKDKDFNFLYSNLHKVKVKCNLYVVGNFNTKIYKNDFENVKIIPQSNMNVNELVKFLYGKDIFISSSSYDTFSIAAAECMSLGLVPVVTDTTGISKLIIDGKNGFIVKHGNGDELAQKINLLISSEELRNKIAKESRTIYSQLNWPAIFNRYQEIYKELI